MRQATDARYMGHIPGIKVITPATVEDARGMLLTALEDPDPVLVFENSLLYNMKGKVSAKGGKVNIDKAAVMREGADITVLTYGAGVFGVWKQQRRWQPKALMPK